VWLSLSVLELELTTVYDRFNDDHTTLSFVNISDTAPYQNSKVGTLSVTVKAGGYLQSADLSSVHSTSTDVVIGSWGDHTAPQITLIEAQEYGLVAVGVDAGDILIITFDQPTNTPAVSVKSEVDAVFDFSASIGVDYSGAWTSLSTLVLTVIAGECDSEPCNHEGTDVGALSLSVKASASLQSADESSPSSLSQRTVGGSWGNIPSAPTNVTVESVTHDGMMLSFNVPVRSNGANITHYQVLFSVHGKQQPSRMIDAAPMVTSGAGAVLGSSQYYFLSNLQPGTAYTSIRVRAMNYFGAGIDSNAVTATTAHAGAFYFSHARSRVDNNRGDTVVITVTVARHGGADVATMVEYKNNLGINGKLRYQVGIIEQEFSFPVDTLGHSYGELPADTITLTLFNPTHGASLGYPSVTYIALPESHSQSKRDTFAMVNAHSLFDFKSEEEQND
jgi:hypothetical protein